MKVPTIYQWKMLHVGACFPMPSSELESDSEAFLLLVLTLL